MEIKWFLYGWINLLFSLVQDSAPSGCLFNITYNPLS